VELLDFLKGVSSTNGKIKNDVSLFVPIKLQINNEQLTMNNVSSDKLSGSADIMSVVPWTFSTFDLDRVDERIDPQGWELEQFKNNPVIQWAHRYDIPAIGRADGLVVDDGGLHGNIVFNSKEYDAFGWSIGERVKAGVLRAGSVGFRILEIEIPDRAGAADGTSLIFRKQELLEFSICNVPANPFALMCEDFNTGTQRDRDTENNKKTSSDFWAGFITSN
jgi:HK97 family phage prohead protease